jgi:hypothetical protein
MLMMMRRPEFLMMRRPEFLIMRRPCAALRRPAPPCKRGLNGTYITTPIPKLFSREQIPARRDQIPTADMAKNWNHLRPIANKIPEYRAAHWKQLCASH